MRRTLLALVILLFALAPLGIAKADGFCGPSEGCSACPPFEISVDKRGVHITWIYC